MLTLIYSIIFIFKHQPANSILFKEFDFFCIIKHSESFISKTLNILGTKLTKTKIL